MTRAFPTLQGSSMTVLAQETILDEGPRTNSYVLRRGRTYAGQSFDETDAAFLERCVAAHVWEAGDTVLVHADGKHLATAELTIQADALLVCPDAWPAPALRDAAQHLLEVGYGSLLVSMTAWGLRPTEFRAAARCGAEETSVGFFLRLGREIVDPLRARYPQLKLRTQTHFDLLRRSTTYVILSLI